MSILNQGRNEIRLENSGGKCLLENWVEERAVSHLDPCDLNGECTSSAQQFKEGHPAVLYPDIHAKAENTTSVQESYKEPVKSNVRQTGKRAELFEKMLYEKVSEDVNQEFNPPPEPTEFKTMTSQDYNKDDFVSQRPVATKVHDFKTEQPATFWTEHKNQIAGVSQVKTSDTPFRKNDAFSKPIAEYQDQPKPYEQQNLPNM